MAILARKLESKATIFIPLSTPQMKQRAMRSLGRENVEVFLFGDSYDEVTGEAKRISLSS
ncbi:MAG: hypothetical protein CMI18_01075 [Opitutaceae bacterium]|nr:hypothetical protein [Opitutaceae bacterium]